MLSLIDFIDMKNYDPICMIEFIPWPKTEKNNKTKTIYNSVLVKRMKKSEKCVTFTNHLNVCRKIFVYTLKGNIKKLQSSTNVFSMNKTT